MSIVRGTYEVDYCFQIPEGVDLNDKLIVDNWYVKYCCLIINYTDGREEIIEAYDTEPMSKPTMVEIMKY